jgi:hypothetical protein
MKKLPADCMPQCKTCAFAQKEDGGLLCHRLPPVPVTDDEGYGFTFVPVDETDWCGEYKRRLQG